MKSKCFALLIILARAEPISTMINTDCQKMSLKFSDSCQLPRMQIMEAFNREFFYGNVAGSLAEILDKDVYGSYMLRM